MMAQNRVLAVAVGRSRFYLLCSSAPMCDRHLKIHPKIEIINGTCSKIKMEDLLWCSNHSVEYLVHSPDKPHFREPWCRWRRRICVACTKYRCKNIGHTQLHWSLLRRPLVDLVYEFLPYHPLASAPPMLLPMTWLFVWRRSPLCNSHQS